MTPTLSVVIPTYQRNDLLAACLARLSPTVQTCEVSYEVIVSDDGKAQTAEALVRDQFPFARWIEGPHQGPACNRNFGARQAQADWVAFTDDDCLPTPGWIGALWQGRMAHPDCVAFEGKTTCPDDLTNPMLEAPLNEWGGCLWSCNLLVRKADFLALGGFDEDFPYPALEDTDFRERLAGSGRCFAYIPEAHIEHPARPTKTGIGRWKMRESDFMLAYKIGRTTPYTPHMLKHLVKRAVKLPIEHRFHPGAFRLAGDTLGQFFYVLQHGRGWDAHYRQKYQGKRTPYPPDVQTRLV